MLQHQAWWWQGLPSPSRFSTKRCGREMPLVHRGDTHLWAHGKIFSGGALLGFGLQTSILKESPLCHIWRWHLLHCFWHLTSFTAEGVAPVKAHLRQQLRLSPPLDVSHLHWWKTGAQLLKCCETPKHRRALRFSDFLQSDQRAEAAWQCFLTTGPILAVCSGLSFPSHLSETVSCHVMWSAPFPPKRFVLILEDEQIVACYKEWRNRLLKYLLKEENMQNKRR